MMSNWKFTEVIVVDLESTCWETEGEQAVNTSEIIEIGVCALDTLTGEIRNPQGIIVKPQLSTVSLFCKQLTGISQEMVNDGISFEGAINTLRTDYSVSRKILAGYGNYDKSMLVMECERKGIKPPYGPTYLNISAMATLKFKAGKRLGLKRASEMAGLQFEGQHHRGIDDAVMAARVLWEIIK